MFDPNYDPDLLPELFDHDDPIGELIVLLKDRRREIMATGFANVTHADDQLLLVYMTSALHPHACPFVLEVGNQLAKTDYSQVDPELVGRTSSDRH